MMQYKQAKLKLASQKEAITAAQERIAECEAEITVERNQRYSVMDRIAELESIIADGDSRIMQLKIKLADNTSTAKTDIARLNAQQDELQKRKKNETSHLELAQRVRTNERADPPPENLREKKVFQTILEQTAKPRYVRNAG